jgi:hypothetical protein
MEDDSEKKIKKYKINELLNQDNRINKRFGKLELGEKSKSKLGEISKVVDRKDQVIKSKVFKSNLKNIKNKDFNKYRFHYSFVIYRNLFRILFFFTVGLIILSRLYFQGIDYNPENAITHLDSLQIFFYNVANYINNTFGTFIEVLLVLFGILICYIFLFMNKIQVNDLTIDRDGIVTRYDYRGKVIRQKIYWGDIVIIKHVKLGMFQYFEVFNKIKTPMGKIYLDLEEPEKIIPTLKLVIPEDHTLIKFLKENLKY